MGKSQIAAEYAHKHTETYDAILWLDAENTSTIAEEFGKIAVELGLVLEGTAVAKDQYLAAEVVKGWLAKPVRSYNADDNVVRKTASWLLIFDNVEDPDVLLDYWPLADSNGAILVTTRDRRAARPGLYPIDQGVILDSLAKADAAKLLLKLTWREQIEEEEALSAKVAEKLGCYPLAIILMAGVVVTQEMSFSEFLDRYEEESTHHSLFEQPLSGRRKRSGYEHTLATVFKLESLQHANGLLEVLSLLDPDRVPEDVLVAMIGKSSLSGFPRTTMDYYDARAELLRHSLVSMDKKVRLKSHRMVQDIVRAKMLERSERVQETFGTAVDILKAGWPQAEAGMRHHVQRWQRCAALSPHIERLIEHYERARPETKDLLRSNLGLAYLANEVGWYLHERGRTKEAQPYFAVALANTEHVIGQQQQDPEAPPSDQQKALAQIAEVYNNMAGSAHELNDGQIALDRFTKYCETLQHPLLAPTTKSDARIASCLNNIGLSHTMIGHYDQAILLYQQSLEAAEVLANRTKRLAARSLALINWGLTAWQMRDLATADDKLLLALREREELFGVNDRTSMITGRILHCLGNVRRSQGLLTESMQYHEQALDHFRNTVGDLHHRTGNSCYKLAEHYVRLDSLDSANNLLDQAQRIFGSREWYKGETGRVFVLQSEVLLRLGRDEISGKHLEEAKRLWRSLDAQSLEGDLHREDFDAFVHVWGR